MITLSRIPPLLALAMSIAVPHTLPAIELSDAQARAIGQKIWQNECAGSVRGLTSWNAGEEFPSLGIAHFIWYPKGVRAPFVESFPGLVDYLVDNGVAMPPWTRSACPWTTRREFLADLDGPRLKELRHILSRTVALQARYASTRLEESLPMMLKVAPPDQRDRIRHNFQRVAAQPMGPYALMDYVNFKGEGTSPRERYQGHGWGLLQVLARMNPSGPALPAFREAAVGVLEERVKNSPPSRKESRWMNGWKNRIATYRD